jgi:hypothetical protein
MILVEACNVKLIGFRRTLIKEAVMVTIEAIKADCRRARVGLNKAATVTANSTDTKQITVMVRQSRELSPATQWARLNPEIKIIKNNGGNCSHD